MNAMNTNRRTLLSRDALKLGLSAAVLVGLAACSGEATTPSSSTAQTAVATIAPAVQAASDAAVATESTTAPTTAAESDAGEAAQSAVFQIDSSQSTATFTLNEKLLGNPTTVTGATSKVSGEISTSLNDWSNAQIGTIQIDASDFSTDSSMRDRAIKNFILQTAQDGYQYITFEPTVIEGLPANVNTGDSVSFKVIGNLKIRDIVQPVTFDVTATAKSDSEIVGAAKTTITRSAFELTIPNVPSVADVTDDVALELQFVATKA